MTATAPSPPLDGALAAHHDALLVDRRCGRCAERVSPTAILRGDACARCGASLAWRGRGDVLAGLDAARSGPRALGYALVGLACALAGALPFAHLVVQASGLALLHVVLLRRPLGWLSPLRRLLARLTLRLVGAVLVTGSLVGAVLVAPLHAVPGLGAAMNAGAHGLSGLVGAVLYVELGLALLGARLHAEATGRPVSAREWAPPLLAAGALGAACVAVGASIYAAWSLVGRLDVPSVAGLVGRWVGGTP